MKMKSPAENIVEMLRTEHPDLFKHIVDVDGFTKKCEQKLQRKPEQENFFTHSTVSYFLKKNAHNQLDNIIIDYDGRSYLRIMKLFKQDDSCQLPLHKTKFDGSCFADKTKLLDEMHKPFHLRFYIPKNIVGTKGRKIEKLVVMFNGLNEWEHFNLFDILGEYFAENNIAAVLLPTPLNLNRRIESDIDKKGTIIKFPSDYANNGNEILFYLSYLKSYRELCFLVNKVKRDANCRDDEDDFGFYKNYFDGRNTEIVLTGYSLGGLKALGYFLKKFNSLDESKADNKKYLQSYKEQQLFHACVTINSGLNLPNAHIEYLAKGTHLDKDKLNDQWKELLDKVRVSIIKNLELLQKNKCDDFVDIFRFLYFRDSVSAASIEEMENMVKNISPNFLALSGGSDPIVNIRQIQSLSTEPINQFIFAGGDHFPGMETSAWPEIFPRAENSILYFIRHCCERHFTEKEIRSNIELLINRSLKKMKHSYSVDEFREVFYERHMVSVLAGLSNSDKEEFKRYYFLSKAFYPNFPLIINKIY